MSDSVLDVVKRHVMMTKKIAVVDFVLPEFSATLYRDLFPENATSSSSTSSTTTTSGLPRASVTAASLPPLPRKLSLGAGLGPASSVFGSSRPASSSISGRENPPGLESVLLFKMDRVSAAVVKRPYDLSVSLQLGLHGLIFSSSPELEKESKLIFAWLL